MTASALPLRAGIRKFEEYASVMEQDNELEMEDLQYVSEKNLMEMGITAIGCAMPLDRPAYQV